MTDSSSTIESRSAAAKAKSAVTNGSKFLPDIDGRSTWARRARDIITQLIEDRGGEDLTSEAERLILRKAAVIAVQTEQLEATFAGGQCDWRNGVPRRPGPVPTVGEFDAAITRVGWTGACPSRHHAVTAGRAPRAQG